MARRTLCTSCAEHKRCSWLGQLRGLAERHLILGTQAYFDVAPLVLLRGINAARSALVLLDEDLILTRKYKQVLGVEELRRHQALLREAVGRGQVSAAAGRAVEAQLNAVGELLNPARDPGDLRPVPLLPPDVAADVQQGGLERYGDEYRFLGNELFTCLLSRRFRNSGGAPGYIWRPWLGDSTVVLLSAELDPAIVRHRLGREVHSVFPPRYTQHSGTRVYNIRDLRFCARYLPGHLAHFDSR